jgi:hypothetical protein
LNLSKTPKEIIYNTNSVSPRLIASPNIRSKFSPSLTIWKSPSLMKRHFEKVPFASKNLLNKISINKTVESKNILGKYTTAKLDKASIIQEEKPKTQDIKAMTQTHRKNRTLLKNIEELPQTSIHITKQEHSDLPITPAVKLSKKCNFLFVEEPKG